MQGLRPREEQLYQTSDASEIAARNARMRAKPNPGISNLSPGTGAALRLRRRGDPAGIGEIAMRSNVCGRCHKANKGRPAVKRYISRRPEVILSHCAAAILTVSMPVHAGASSDYPDRPIQVYVPFAAGSASDVITRILLGRMATILWARTSWSKIALRAGGNTGTAAAAHAAPDGYTLVMSTSGPLAANKALFKQLGYDPQKDFATNLFVRHSSQYRRDQRETSAQNAAGPDQLCKGTPQAAQLRLRLAWALRNIWPAPISNKLTGTQLVHVPYRNIASYTPDFISGQVPVGFQLLPNVIGLIKNGDARALAVAGNKTYDGIARCADGGRAGLQGYESSAWLALLAPANMDKALVDKLYAAARAP